MTLPVSSAMSDDRPAKQAVRKEFWLDAIKRRASKRPENVPLYVTLAGAEGRDIDLLVDEGFIDLTETGAISESSAGVAIAIESNSDARSSLLGKFFGLEVLHESYENLIRGPSLIRFPGGKDLNIWRSVVINLDLNEPLILDMDDDRLQLPLVEKLIKVATIQRDKAHPDGWTLLLTLHSALLVSSDARAATCVELARVMRENFAHSEAFATTFGSLVGFDPDALYFESLCTLRGEKDDPASETLRQKTLLLLVPKLIVDAAASLGWSVVVSRSAYYGGEGDAPMTTWVLDFGPTAKAGAAGRIALALASLGKDTMSIQKDGTLVELDPHG